MTPRRHQPRGPAAVLAVLAAAVLAACTPTQSPNPGDPASTATEGWEVLFDGATIGGLRGYGVPSFPIDAWRVEGGRLTTVAGPGVDLVSVGTYADFELEFTWRVTRGGNGGVLYRVAETGQPAWVSGPEYQVVDDAGHPDGRNPETSAGAVYDLIAPAKAAGLPPGGDNAGRIVVRAGRVEHWLNGEIVVVYEWRSPEVLASIATSKFAALREFMTADAGHIVLQHHGEVVAYGLIRIRRL